MGSRNEPAKSTKSNFHLCNPNMPAHKSQKVAENDKKIQIAIDALLNDKDLSVTEAAKVYGVNHITLSRRFKRGKSIAESREQQQHLSIPEEEALIKWITHMTSTGNPPKQQFIQEMSKHLHNTHAQWENVDISSLISPLKIGDSWVQHFLHQHPELETVISCTIESSRLKETSKKISSASWTSRVGNCIGMCLCGWWKNSSIDNSQGEEFIKQLDS